MDDENTTVLILVGGFVLVHIFTLLAIADITTK